MWGVLRTALVATLILLLIHQIYNHLQSTLTVPLIADMVKRPEKKYADIDAILKPDMKSELSSFLSHLK